VVEAAVAVKPPGAEIVAAVTSAVTAGAAENTASAAPGTSAIAMPTTMPAQRTLR
jgi:hypothetical protein